MLCQHCGLDIDSMNKFDKYTIHTHCFFGLLIWVDFKIIRNIIRGLDII